MSKRITAFDGQVVFVMHQIFNLHREIVRDTLVRAFNYDQLPVGSSLKSYLAQFITCVPGTETIEFHTNGQAHPVIENLRTFWREVEQSADYVHLFHRFTHLIADEVSEAWWRAYNEAPIQQYTAPAELGETNEELAHDPNA